MSVFCKQILKQPQAFKLPVEGKKESSSPEICFSPFCAINRCPFPPTVFFLKLFPST